MSSMKTRIVLCLRMPYDSANNIHTPARLTQSSCKNRATINNWCSNCTCYKCHISLSRLGLRRTSIPWLLCLDCNYINTSCTINSHQPLMTDRKVSGDCLQNELAENTQTLETETGNGPPRTFSFNPRKAFRLTGCVCKFTESKFERCLGAQRMHSSLCQ